jgi:hypothetical protein
VCVVEAGVKSKSALSIFCNIQVSVSVTTQLSTTVQVVESNLTKALSVALAGHNVEPSSLISSVVVNDAVVASKTALLLCVCLAEVFAATSVFAETLTSV